MGNKLVYNVDFTTTSADYDLMQNIDVKTAIKQELGWDEPTYQNALVEGVDMYFEIDVKNTKISTNGYLYTKPRYNSVYYPTSNENATIKVKTIRIENTGISGLISFYVVVGE